MPVEISGAWSGKVGPFKASFRFDDSGKGYFCYTGRGANKIEWASYSHGTIYTEKKTDVVIERLTNDVMHVEVMNFGSKKYIFHKDNELKKGSWFCRKYLR